MEAILERLEVNPIIAALPHMDRFEEVLSSPAEVVFILSGKILEISEKVRMLKEKDKKVFVHIDLIDGLGKDLSAVDYIQQVVKPEGIISTRNNLIRYGKEIGLVTVQRLFLVDSLAFESGIKMIESHGPDFVEVMPGIIPRAIVELKKKIRQPIIAGGMISDKEDIIQALKAGAIAVSTSKKELWEIQ